MKLIHPPVQVPIHTSMAVKVTSKASMEIRSTSIIINTASEWKKSHTFNVRAFR